jgi:hypothetical protein
VVFLIVRIAGAIIKDRAILFLAASAHLSRKNNSCFKADMAVIVDNCKQLRKNENFC